MRGNSFKTPALEVSQLHDATVAGLEAVQRVAQRFEALDAGRVVIWCGAFVRLGLCTRVAIRAHEAQTVRTAAHLGAKAVPTEPERPALEGGLAGVPRQARPQRDVHLLDHVLEDLRRQPVAHRAVEPKHEPHDARKPDEQLLDRPRLATQRLPYQEQVCRLVTRAAGGWVRGRGRSVRAVGGRGHGLRTGLSRLGRAAGKNSEFLPAFPRHRRAGPRATAVSARVLPIVRTTMKPHVIVDPRGFAPYDLGPGHVFARDRLEPLFELLDAHSWLDADEVLADVPAATDAELALAHAPKFLEFVRELSANPDNAALLREAPIYGLGTSDNPVAPGQHEGGAAVVGGTLACVRAVLDPATPVTQAFNPAGGLHHAMHSTASGFCIYNDLVVAIREAQRLGVQRICYVDFDVHHGDGVEHAFAEDPNVLTVSFHETPDVRWPFTGRLTDRGAGRGLGSAINFPLLSLTDDESWQECVEQTLSAALERFRPGLLVTQHGADPHWMDPLAELRLTTRSFDFAARLAQGLADRYCGRRWIATGGGGYQPIHVLPRAWAIVWAIMSGREIPDRVDSAWYERWRSELERREQSDRAGLCPNFADDPVSVAGAEVARPSNQRTLDRLASVHNW